MKRLLTHMRCAVFGHSGEWHGGPFAVYMDCETCGRRVFLGD